MTPLNYVVGTAIALLFAVLAPAFGLAAIVALPLGARQYSGDVIAALDKVTAAGLGYSGSNTLSREVAMGRSSPCLPCSLVCRALCAVLHYTLEKNHCDKEAT